MDKITLTSKKYSEMDELRSKIARGSVYHKSGKNTRLWWTGNEAELTIMFESDEDYKETLKVIGS